jgi:hypothetical protein
MYHGIYSPRLICHALSIGGVALLCLLPADSAVAEQVDRLAPISVNMLRRRIARSARCRSWRLSPCTETKWTTGPCAVGPRRSADSYVAMSMRPDATFTVPPRRPD